LGQNRSVLSTFAGRLGAAAASALLAGKLALSESARPLAAAARLVAVPSRSRAGLLVIVDSGRGEFVGMPVLEGRRQDNEALV
jgi:hypothetical protein